MRVAITGATGFIGSQLVTSLEGDGHLVVRLTRRPSRPGDVLFDPARRLLDPQAIEGLDAVVHLAGEPIAQRWTSSAKRRIRESRVHGTRLVAESIAATTTMPPVLVSGSAIGIYGDRGDEILTEHTVPGDDFLAEVCCEWEGAADPARDVGVRVVHPRMGLVLDRRGGALARLLPPFQLGLGGPTGLGRQWTSWIAMEDAVRALRHAIVEPGVTGAMNVVGPAPVTNRELTRALGHALHRPAIIPTPPIALRLVFREMADATLMASQRAIPEVLQRSGFAFRHRDVDSALRAALES